MEISMALYIEMVEVMVSETRHVRYGQALFNILLDIDSDTANLIRGTNYDPFYCKNKYDKRVKLFMNYIEQYFPIITNR